mgnify:CR=1 FL=1
MQIVECGWGGYCDSFRVDKMIVDECVIAYRHTHYIDTSRRYYIIPCDHPCEVLEVFGNYMLEEDEPGTLLLRQADDVTAANIGVYAAVLDGEIH